ncbi:T9SS type A sorting domain-containing protein [Constantimarinum furrinae]|uniref:Secretion system C-terminal sorting domain-containing protein n=1 Tax=Constantimarinum furrinae TaxID=2562285 RepID=A0A7G8PRJ0_9FLAO|nr:T9SS type A sorting domain-containing protein [Constantimarinum furrinae]QNJ96956.1 hypothetical protein ALE3EI_0369 [Constantimarinum furrinae]
MKKITTKKLSKRLSQYGALSLAIAGVSDAAGQIIYTDIDPDETITGSNYMLDLDGDTSIDYDIIARSDVPAVRVYNSNSNSILGLNFGGNYNYPLALSSGAPISSGQNFYQHSVYQTLNWGGCTYTNSQWCGGQVDKYLGLRFNIGGDTHYGWVRLDVPADGSNFTIKDYAYESTPDMAIAAGDTGGLGVGDEAFSNFQFLVDTNNQLVLKAAVAMDNVDIYNVLGQKVISQDLTSTNETIDLSAQTSGIYLATVTIEGAQRTIKVVKK